MDAKERILKGQCFRHKKSVAGSIKELNALFENQLMDLIYSMESHGYMESKSSDPCRVMISRTGSVIKGRRGRHRFAAARLTGVREVPVLVSHMHLEFARRQGVIESKRINTERLCSAIRRVERAHQ